MINKLEELGLSDENIKAIIREMVEPEFYNWKLEYRFNDSTLVLKLKDSTGRIVDKAISVNDLLYYRDPIWRFKVFVKDTMQNLIFGMEDLQYWDVETSKEDEV